MKIVKSLLIRILVIVILVFPGISSGQVNSEIVFGEKKMIHSKILGEDREYWVHLPLSYDKSSDAYPVLYITDGDAHFYLASGTSQFMSVQYKTPELIIVAIFSKNRNHEFTPTHCIADNYGNEKDEFTESGGGEKFLQFIERELIVRIDSNYRTEPYKILAGHSLGGLFSIYVYLTRSNLFNSFIAMDPALLWDNQLCERTLKSLNSQAPNFKNKLYISSANNSQKKRDKSPFRKAQDSFCKAYYAKLNSSLKHDYFEKDNHWTVPFQSFYEGLSYFFYDYDITHSHFLVPDTSIIQDHYKRASNIYGIKFKPPEGYIELLGYIMLVDQKNYIKSIELYKLNVLNYPHSYKAYENLAKGYKASGNTTEAISNFKKSLELNPENTEIQKLLIELRER